ncbi:hypothetical protein EYV94_14695 [Puteibacter caeruleilacunae]|nr:hypothetical protein EYV94_14695 [Puteibacter caeruleilacunae]
MSKENVLFILGALFLGVLGCSSSENPDVNFNNELDYPSNVKVTFDENTESATITWDKVDAAEGYTVWCSYAEDSNYDQLADVTETTYTDESVKRASEKYYKVKTYNTKKESIYSVPVSVVNPLNDEERKVVRSMWVWNNTNGLDATKRVDLLEFCKEHHIEILYFSTGLGDYTANATLKQNTRNFIKAAHQNNIEVHGLTGNPDWILPANQSKYLNAVKSIIAYNNTVESDECFDGYQSDIEPNKYVGKNWSTAERIQNLKYYVDVHKKAADLFNNDLKKPVNFQYGMAISAFYDLHGEELKFEYEGKNQITLAHLADFSDYFAIMSYRDKASNIIDISKQEVEIMKALGKKAWTGVETIDTESKGAGPSSINFYHEGNDFMEQEIEKVKAYYFDNDGFGGIAVHYYRTYKELVERE